MEGQVVDMKDMIEKYRRNYIAKMRKDVGHAPLMVTSCGVIIENDKGEILLQKRRNNGFWALLGGSMEIGDICYVTGIIFKTTVYSGEIQNNTELASHV